MIFILCLILFLYFTSIGLLVYGFTKIPSYKSTGLTPKTKFTIIVPFRNESKNLPLLLESFSKLNYPVEIFSVILVDDQSDVAFPLSDFAFQVSILKNDRVSNSPKKDAITTAMRLVKTDWVITTDADCVVHKNWLLTLDNYIQSHDVSMLAGPVTYDCNESFLHHFQQLDLTSLQGATIGSFGLNKAFMCNGANLAYTQTLFRTLDGFNGNNGIVSGDDVFLLQKAAARFPEHVYYLKSQDTIVITKPLDDWKTLLHQRVRWASKTTSYQSPFGKFLGLVVFGGNLACVVGAGCWVFDFIPFQNIILLFLSKFVIDSILICKTHLFLTPKKMRYLILSSLLYPFFSTAVALYSLFGKYEWKGRRF